MVSKRIRQARLAAGLSLDECVERLKSKNFSITKPALSQYENGKRRPNPTVLLKLSEIFSLPASWFLGTATDCTMKWYSYRAQISLGKATRESIKAYAALEAEKRAFVYSLFPESVKANFPQRKKISSIPDSDSFAADLRKRWNLGTGPLESVTQTLEIQGAMIVHYNGQQTAKFDGMSAIVNDIWPMLIINPDVPVDRLRFDLTHELGHIIMDTYSLGSTKEEESAAHRFASSFLLPPPSLKKELGTKRHNLSLHELLLLKEKFGISVSASLYAARTHGIITERLFVKLRKELSIRGWRKKEPDVFCGNEKPARMRQLLTRAVAENLITLGKVSAFFPDIAEELKGEFPAVVVEGRGEMLRKLPKAQRDAILLKAAENAAKEYCKNADLIADDDHGYYEYD